MSKKDYPIQIGSKQYLLRYNFDALTYVEDVTGKGFFESLADLQAGKLKFMKVLFFAGLRQNHPEIDPDSVGELIDECEDLKSMVHSVITAINNYFVKDKPAAKKKTVQAGSPTETEE